MIHTRISGTGSYLPGEPVSNAALIAAHGLDSSDDWIIERTGIRSRHLAAAGVTSSDLGAEAARRALEAAGVAAQDVDLIIVGSHGRHGWRLVLGSTANAVLHGARCDVLAARVAPPK